MWSRRAQHCLLKRSIFLYWTCFSGLKNSLLAMGLAAKTLVLYTIYNSLIIDLYPSYAEGTAYMVQHLENLLGLGFFSVKKYKNAHGFTRISSIRRVFHISIVSKVSFSAGVLQTSRYCMTAAGQFGYWNACSKMDSLSKEYTSADETWLLSVQVWQFGFKNY